MFSPVVSDIYSVIGQKVKMGVESSWSGGMYPHKNENSVPGPQSRETCQISGFTQSNSTLPAGPPLAVS